MKKYWFKYSYQYVLVVCSLFPHAQGKWDIT